MGKRMLRVEMGSAVREICTRFKLLERCGKKTLMVREIVTRSSEYEKKQDE
ncbi:unnamed protein product [Sphenostylis stenocarpa]|uniref:Uncharacterized protein n=1 Tax=Sphenostylis stenocarpa TaxID=92480 RepID=A0AA86THH6_9FABA|nr:unnamed protein product [Sphenostylis stenocarpa]